MPVHSSEEDAHASGHSNITESVASNPSSNTESHASDKKKTATAEEHAAAPGPAIVQSIGDAKVEGTREEREARARALNGQ
jgi:hypothetical protein